MRKLKFLLPLCLGLICSAASAQEYGMEYSNEGWHPNPLRPVHESDIMFRKHLTYQLDLRQKQNKPLFANNQEITKLIMEAAKLGVVHSYEDESLTKRMDQQTFEDNLKIDAGDPMQGTEWILTDPSIWDDPEPDTDEVSDSELVANEYLPNQLYLLEFTEDLIFDRKRSRLVHDMQTMTIKIPAAYNPADCEKSLATFSHKELVQNLFRDNPSAIWYNAQNSEAHLNLEGFSGVVGVLTDNGGAELNYQYTLTEYENNLWEN